MGVRDIVQQVKCLSRMQEALGSVPTSHVGMVECVYTHSQHLGSKGRGLRDPRSSSARLASWRLAWDTQDHISHVGGGIGIEEKRNDVLENV